MRIFKCEIVTVLRFNLLEYYILGVMSYVIVLFDRMIFFFKFVVVVVVVPPFTQHF